MEIYTLNVSQGQFVVVVGKKEAFIVDTYIPLSSQQDTEHIVEALASILKDKNLKGLLVTGFDADHFCEPGMKVVLNKYRPDWRVYPKYFKKTGEADACFKAIETLLKEKDVQRYSIMPSNNEHRFYRKFCDEFTFEVFSPNADDANSSNNCSIVCKVRERATGATYLITGDTENARWENIVKAFGSALKSDVLAAAHHGSRNGLTESALKVIQPHTILISAGVGNQFGRPHPEALQLWNSMNGRRKVIGLKMPEIGACGFPVSETTRVPNLKMRPNALG